jgi:ADP-heptose:LPS heptosyltransferase
MQGVEFHSLQIGDEARSQFGLEDCITDHGSQLRDFADTAALVANLDLVICVDTSIAHLTGALGKPFWLLNRYNTCWRWLAERSDSPWYPTARLFRQPQPGDWESVIRSVRHALEDFVAARNLQNVQNTQNAQ